MRLSMKSLVIVAAAALAAPAALADGHGGDAAKGEKVFKKCKACHKIGDGAKNASGPVLNGVIGRTAGTYEGYRYSKSLIAAGEKGLVWTEEELAKFIENPSQYLKDYLDDPKAKSKMSLKLKKEEDRKNVAAFLATLSE